MSQFDIYYKCISYLTEEEGPIKVFHCENSNIMKEKMAVLRNAEKKGTMKFVDLKIIRD